ncbi:IclR family transcriptional regulator [Paenibacillus larvae]|uniref:Glycerol operon regulatory protein n=4 Tax=Paenibacillus larvae TaxID=1464 RepID=V9W4P9_9BACL|nr:IclR family transcriptional regulator [Paenibacillus larvae]AHD04610.1 transcriptional regulator, IclR family, C-terminal domain protein [Paenibacillus larvae subsp. larvae DSM 25430]AQR78273.1 IclR family transcriptional regulator [Paenibacillus larvae subsp. larvae]AQT84520.1 IclR family transcriptional regulator [Paenibacillus larvae subsp. pulvifaciens]AQZ46518.1 IclR family transcriptional regulator [Paenibacillus larvae subsp. pulvifaciens]ARF67922.1 IclR family transcriptional regula
MEEHKLTVRSVERALDILLCFRDSSELTLTEISNQAGLHKSTVHRLLASLEGKGFLLRDSSGDKYRLGFSVWELSANLSQGDDISMLLLPEMEWLRDQVGETISIYVRDGKERVRIQAVQSKHAIRRVAPVGARMPLYVGASSKVLVAFGDEALQVELAHDARSSVGLDPTAFLKQLAETREQGFATSMEEREPGAAALSAPILNRSGKLVAALAISGPISRLTPEQMQAYAPLLLESSGRMGTMVR